jgi:hypothetical protein
MTMYLHPGRGAARFGNTQGIRKMYEKYYLFCFRLDVKGGCDNDG